MNLTERRTMSLAERKTLNLAARKAVELAERRWRRLKVDTPVVLHAWEGVRQADLMTRSYELSEGGMAVSVPGRLEVGAPVTVSFSLAKDENELRLRAIVRSQRGARYGLEFIDLDDNDRDQLARFVDAMTGVPQS